MKTNRNIWRIVTLALALVMLFSVVACSNEEEEPAITTAAEGTTTAPSTTKKPATTEKPTTQAPTTQTTATTEPTTEPTTELPAYSVVMPSGFDADGDGVNDSYTFSNKIPELFAGEGVIKLGCDDHLDTDKGVGRTEGVTGSGVYHVYIDRSKADIPDDEKTLTWVFEVAEAGTYEICFNMRMKDGKQRGNVMTIDGGTAMAMDFQFFDGSEKNVRDADLNSYMTGISVELTAGSHTMQMKYNAFCEKTFHFRNIYIAKSTKNAIDYTCNFDNDGDGVKDVLTFSNYMPMEYGAAGVITVHAGDYDKELSKGVGKAERQEGSGIYHYYVNLSEKGNIPDDEQNMTYKFTVAEAGKYKVCFGLGMKSEPAQRGAAIYLNGSEKSIDVDYEVDGAFAAQIMDSSEGSYLTGLVVDLVAGENVMVIKYQPLLSKTMHFRNFYFLKMVEAAA